MKRVPLHVGDVISTLSAADGTWLDGEVVSIDPVEVMYEGGKKEVDLTALEYKVSRRKPWKRRLRGTEKLAPQDEEASKTFLHLIQNLLVEFEDKLVSLGLMKTKVEWRRAWRASLYHAYETANTALMVDVTSQIALQLKAEITSPWWVEENVAWREHLLNLTTSAELQSLVTELTSKAVSWRLAPSEASGKHGLLESSSAKSTGGHDAGSGKGIAVQCETKQVESCARLVKQEEADKANQMNGSPGKLVETNAEVREQTNSRAQCEKQHAGYMNQVELSSVRVEDVLLAKKPLKRLRKVGEHVDVRNEGRYLRSKIQNVGMGHSQENLGTFVKEEIGNCGGLEAGRLPVNNVNEEAGEKLHADPNELSSMRKIKFQSLTGTNGSKLLDPEGVPWQRRSSSHLKGQHTHLNNRSEESDTSNDEGSSNYDDDDDDSMYSSESSCMKDRLRLKGRPPALRASERIREKRKPNETKIRTVSSKRTRQTVGEHGWKNSEDSGVVDLSASDDGTERNEPQWIPDSSIKIKGAKGQKTALAEKTTDGSLSETDELCAICQFAGAAELMLLCDNEGCEYACHTFCLQPPLHVVPEGDWVCPNCSGPPRTKKVRDTFASKEIEKLLGRRRDTLKTKVEDQNSKLEYLVKWRSYSHHHDSWVPEDWLSFFDRTRLLAFHRKHPLNKEAVEVDVDDRRTEWFCVDRVIGYRIMGSDGHLLPQTSKTSQTFRKASRQTDTDMEGYECLVKWKGMDYDAATWEKCATDDIKAAFRMYKERHEKADTQAFQSQNIAFANLKVQPEYVDGGVLHNYQLSGLKWLLSNFLERKSVILADEMGLGKTIQAAAFMVCARREALAHKPFLVIAPKSTLSGWEQELHTWASSLNSLVYHGGKDARTVIQNYEFFSVGKKPLFDVLVTSYELAMIDSSILQKFQWSTIIVDEGHRVKNFRCKLSTLLKRQHSDFRVLLTGTPVQNTLAELFALLHFLDPIEFKDPDDAACEFAHVDAIGTSSLKDATSIQEQVTRIHELLRPRMLRRLKTEVLRDMLPGKKLIEVPCALTPYQRRLYITILQKNYKELNKGVKNGQKRSLNSILMDLKMCCNHPYLFPGKEPKLLPKEEEYRLLVEASGKFQLLDKLLPLLKKEGHRVLLFSQMTKMLDIIEDFLTFLGLSFCRIDGCTSSADRLKQITEFNNPESTTFIFLISTRAGGLGINLPSADTVIIYDPDFNPFVDLQAQARAHRIGQVKTVLVYQLITKCSVEEKILQRSRKKLAMENLVMSSAAKETAQDLNELLLHGARSVIDEHNLEATSVRYTEEDLKHLLSRDIFQSGEDTAETTGYLGAIQTPEDTGSLAPKAADGSEWDELLGGISEQKEVLEELGRGKRSRKAVKYEFEPNLEDEDEYRCSQENQSSESSGSEASLDVEEPSPTKLGRCKTNVQVFDQEGSSAQGEPDLNNFPKLGSIIHTSGTWGNPLLQDVTVASVSITNVIPTQNTGSGFVQMLNLIHKGHPPMQANAGLMRQIPIRNPQTKTSGIEAGDSGQLARIVDPERQGHLAVSDVTSTSFRKATGQFLQVPAPTLQHQSFPAGLSVNASRPELVEVLSSFRRYVEAMNASCLPAKNIRAGGDLSTLGILSPPTSPSSSSPSVKRPELLDTQFHNSMSFSEMHTSACLSTQISTQKLEDLKLQVVPCDSMQPATSGHVQVVGSKLPHSGFGSRSVDKSCSTLAPVLPVTAWGGEGISQAANLHTGSSTSNVGGSQYDIRVLQSDLHSSVFNSQIENPVSREVPESAVPVNTAGVCQERSSIFDSKYTLVAVAEAKQVPGADVRMVLMENLETAVTSTSTTMAKLSQHMKASVQQSSRQLQVKELKSGLEEPPFPAVSPTTDVPNEHEMVPCDLSNSLLASCSPALVASSLVNGATEKSCLSDSLITHATLPAAESQLNPSAAISSEVGRIYPAVCPETPLAVSRELSEGHAEKPQFRNTISLLQPELLIQPLEKCCPACQTSERSSIPRSSDPSGALDIQDHPPVKSVPNLSKRPHALFPRFSRNTPLQKKPATMQEPRKPLWLPAGEAGLLMFQSPRQAQQVFETKVPERVASPPLPAGEPFNQM